MASSFCGIYEPVYYDQTKVPKRTADQIDSNNSVYDANCIEEKETPH